MISLFLPPLDPETWDAVPRWAWIVYGLGFLPPWVLLAWGLLAFTVHFVPMRTLPKDYLMATLGGFLLAPIWPLALLMAVVGWLLSLVVG